MVNWYQKLDDQFGGRAAYPTPANSAGGLNVGVPDKVQPGTGLDLRWSDVRGGVWVVQSAGNLVGTLQGGTASDYLARPSAENQRDQRITVTFAPVAAGPHFLAALRFQSDPYQPSLWCYYFARFNTSTKQLGIYKYVNGAETLLNTLASWGGTYAAGDSYVLDLQAIQFDANNTQLNATLYDRTTDPTLGTPLVSKQVFNVDTGTGDAVLHGSGGYALVIDGTVTITRVQEWDSVAAATTYRLDGPANGAVSSPSTPLIISGVNALVSNTITAPNGPMVVTPSDGGAGGSFSPATVTLNTTTPRASTVYTPPVGVTTPIVLSFTNNRELTDAGTFTYTPQAGSPTVWMAPTDSKIVYGGYWRSTSGGSGALGGTVWGPASTDGQKNFAFTGTKLEAQRYQFSGAGTITVTIDGGAPITLTIPSANTAAWQTVASGLTDTLHQVQVTATAINANSGFDSYAAWRATGAAPSFAVATGWAGSQYILDGTYDTGIIPDPDVVHSATLQGYPTLLFVQYNGPIVRFRAKLNTLKTWCISGTRYLALRIDGVEQPLVNATTSGYGWFTVATGLDDTAYHDYVLERVYSNTGNDFYWSLFAASNTGGGINLAAPPTVPALRFAGFGDSITEAIQDGTDARTGYTVLVGNALGYRPLMRGVNGSPMAHSGTIGGVDRAAAVGADLPTILVDEYGTNDLNAYINTLSGGNPPTLNPATDAAVSAFQANCVTAWTAILTASPTTRMLVLGITERADCLATYTGVGGGSGPSSHYACWLAFNAAKQAAAAQIKAAFPGANIAYLDTTGWLVVNQGPVPGSITGSGPYSNAISGTASTDMVDGLHPNQVGQGKIATRLRLILGQGGRRRFRTADMQALLGGF